MDRMDQFLLGKPKYDLNHPAIKTGFESIDLQTSFLRRGTLALLGSRPGMGTSESSVRMKLSSRSAKPFFVPVQESRIRAVLLARSSSYL